MRFAFRVAHTEKSDAADGRNAPGRIRLVVGLGNPGSRYARTRHNLGFWVVESLVQRHGLTLRRKFSGRLATWMTERGEVRLLMPETFMNESGVSVAQARRAHGLEPAEIVVVHDDLDLPVGRVRVRQKGSSGGHNGIRSIMAHLGTEAFGRVRLGIGHPTAGDVLQHVLSPFRPDEEGAVHASVERAADAIETLLARGYEAAMQVAHAPSDQESGSRPPV